MNVAILVIDGAETNGIKSSYRIRREILLRWHTVTAFTAPRVWVKAEALHHSHER